MDNLNGNLIPQEEAPAFTTLEELVTYCVTRHIPLNQVAIICRQRFHRRPTPDEIVEVLTSVQRNYTHDDVLGNPRA